MRELFKLRIKMASNKHVANMLDKLCWSAVDDHIKPELQPLVCQKLLAILQCFKNFDSNIDSLVAFKNFLAQDTESQTSHTPDKSIFNAYVALNTMIAHYQKKDATVPEIEKGIDVAINFLKNRLEYLEEILDCLRQLNKTRQTQTPSNKKRKLSMFADKPLQAYPDKLAGPKMRRTDDEAVAATNAEPKSDNKSDYCT